MMLHLKRGGGGSLFGFKKGGWVRGEGFVVVVVVMAQATLRK